MLDDYGIARVNVATCTTKDGQDDVSWSEVKVINGKAEASISASNHNFESGSYITHVYAYDKGGPFAFR